tara:strand:+ start:3054 stop:3842 length:789 start_codon:yes stop_codon:yes gene_type:complete
VPYKVRKKTCKKSDGTLGSHTLYKKSGGKLKKIGCTNDPKGAIAARYASERETKMTKESLSNKTIKLIIVPSKLSIGKKCPDATQDLKLNTKNRDASIKAEHIQYGPLNVDEPGDYWKDIAEYWNTTVEAAKKSLCSNCVAFDISPRMDECMPGVTSDKDGRLGYCWMHHFKCHSARACRTWAKGGPIDEDKVSYEWQERNKKSLEERKKKRKKKKKKKGKKDACYYKVKARYKVWPSAYASGALVKCRKVGAKNWGKSKKK